jgi:hypothetical protein
MIGTLFVTSITTPNVSDDVLAPLILDLIEWIAIRSRLYADVMDAWRTSCPRLPVWEEANDRGFIVLRRDSDQTVLVDVTPLGRSFLESNGRITFKTLIGSQNG